MNGASLLWLIPALPLAAVLLNLLLGDRLGRRGVGWLACEPILASVLALWCLCLRNDTYAA